MLERDDRFPTSLELGAELDVIAAAATARASWAALPQPRSAEARHNGAASLRSPLAAVQADLLQALLGDAPVPPRFDRCRIQAATAALRRKRARVAQHAVGRR
jgi:hypothetical protein